MGDMPGVSAFYGIVITLYYNDHLPPHFHALYRQYEALVRIDTLETLAGSLHKRARLLVVEWSLLHRPELRAVWERARRNEPLGTIEPLR